MHSIGFYIKVILKIPFCVSGTFCLLRWKSFVDFECGDRSPTKCVLMSVCIMGFSSKSRSGLWLREIFRSFLGLHSSRYVKCGPKENVAHAAIRLTHRHSPESGVCQSFQIWQPLASQEITHSTKRHKPLSWLLRSQVKGGSTFHGIKTFTALEILCRKMNTKFRIQNEGTQACERRNRSK